MTQAFIRLGFFRINLTVWIIVFYGNRKVVMTAIKPLYLTLEFYKIPWDPSCLHASCRKLIPQKKKERKKS